MGTRTRANEELKSRRHRERACRRGHDQQPARSRSLMRQHVASSKPGEEQKELAIELAVLDGAGTAGNNPCVSAVSRATWHATPRQPSPPRAVLLRRRQGVCSPSVRSALAAATPRAACSMAPASDAARGSWGDTRQR
ncbi:unnamed protein product [Lampetra planeri]